MGSFLQALDRLCPSHVLYNGQYLRFSMSYNICNVGLALVVYNDIKNKRELTI